MRYRAGDRRLAVFCPGRGARLLVDPAASIWFRVPEYFVSISQAALRPKQLEVHGVRTVTAVIWWDWRRAVEGLLSEATGKHLLFGTISHFDPDMAPRYHAALGCYTL